MSAFYIFESLYVSFVFEICVHLFTHQDILNQGYHIGLENTYESVVLLHICDEA